MKKSRISPAQSKSLRQLALIDPHAVQALLGEYYPLCKQAFPMEGELETQDTFYDVLLDQDTTWDIIVLKDEMQNIIGGIHYQVLGVTDAKVDQVAWIEHVFVKLEHRSFYNLRELVRQLKAAINSHGGKLSFLEFHNPQKMTQEEIAESAGSGITVDGILTLLKRAGVCVAVTADGNVAAYGQPSMDGQPPVDYFSIGFVSDNSLSGVTLSADDYLKIMHAAHLTIEGVDTAADPTVVAYTNAVKAGGDMTFKPLAEVL